MKIELSNYCHFVNFNRKNKADKSKSDNSNLSKINLENFPAFTGILVKPIRNARYVTEDCKMEPKQPYLITENSVFNLGDGCIVDLNKSRLFKYKVFKLKPTESIVIGKDSNSKTKASNCVSKKHLQIKRTLKGELVAIDLDSTYGTTICKNTIIPNLKNGEFKLEPKMNYLFPVNAVLQLGPNTEFSLYEYNSYIKELKSNKELTVGYYPDISIPINDDKVSINHLEIRKCKNGVLVRDLGSKNGTYFKKLENVVNCKRNFSKINQVAKLNPNETTLIPKDCQLRLGSNYVLDIRDSNIAKLLDEKGSIIIGKDTSCDVVLNIFYDCERKHLKLEKFRNKIFATDLGSKNGTQVIPKSAIEPFCGGVENIELAQGGIGDCSLLATIYAISRTFLGQEILNNLVKVDEEGNYIVTFNSQEPIVVTLDELNTSKIKKGVHGNLGIKAIERAYAKLLMQKTFLAKYSSNWAHELDKGVYPDDVLEIMTGIESSCENTDFINVNVFLSSLSDKNLKNYFLVCSSKFAGIYGKEREFVDSKMRFVDSHAYIISDIDKQNKKITIINPYNTTFSYTISWDEFEKYFSYVWYAKV